MITCNECNSELIANVNAKCSDLCYFEIPSKNFEHNGYVPSRMAIGEGDYIRFSYCLSCGYIQDDHGIPVNLEDIEDLVSSSENEE